MRTSIQKEFNLKRLFAVLLITFSFSFVFADSPCDAKDSSVSSAAAGHEATLDEEQFERMAAVIGAGIAKERSMSGGRCGLTRKQKKFLKRIFHEMRQPCLDSADSSLDIE